MWASIGRRRRQPTSRRRPQPEGSARLRQLVFAAQIVALIAVALVTGIWSVALVSGVILACGHRYAYQVRAQPKRLIRVLTFVAVHVVLLWMLVGLVSGQPYPQAQAAMLAMAVVSWELFSRVNLYSGFGLGLINLYVAATLSRTTLFGLFLLAFLGCVLAFLWVADSEDGRRAEHADLGPAPRAVTGWPGRRMAQSSIVRFVGALAIATPLIFLLTPRFAGRPLFMPISLNLPIRGGPSAQIINPAVPLLQIGGWSNGESEYYYGFDSRLDLSYRGGLSNNIVMYVRSPAQSFWRSHAFDLYDGRTWTQSRSDVQMLQREPDASFFTVPGATATGEVFVQSYEVVRPLPNLLFTAGVPVELHVAADSVAMDSSGGLRIAEALQPGMTYSVVSVRQESAPAALRTADGAYPAEVAARYLQVPAAVPERVRDLARQLTRDQQNPYDKVEALRSYLQTSYPYDLYPPPQQPGTEAIDQFLFVDRRGVCEQYVSALVIMARELGLPARLVSGFSNGTYNPLTGYYEVRANDAHSWAEVYFQGHGWIAFDPTPGWPGNPSTSRVVQWPLTDLAQQLNLPAFPVEQTAAAGYALVTWLLGPVVAAVAVGLGVAAWRIRRRRARLRSTPRYAETLDPRRRKIFAAYRRAQRALSTRRPPWQTVQEQAAAYPELAELADAVDIAAYRPEPPDEQLVSVVVEPEGQKGNSSKPR